LLPVIAFPAAHGPKDPSGLSRLYLPNKLPPRIRGGRGKWGGDSRDGEGAVGGGDSRDGEGAVGGGDSRDEH